MVQHSGLSSSYSSSARTISFFTEPGNMVTRDWLAGLTCCFSLHDGCSHENHKTSSPMFVVLREGVQLDEALTTKNKQTLRKNASPHHVPDEILAVKEIPLTLSGKKTEVPVKKLLMGVPVEKAVSMDALRNPQAIASFITFAQKVRASREASQ